MKPNVDNLTVLPFYGPYFDWDGSKPDWNSRKPWAFGQAYPLVVPYGYLPTAQLLFPPDLPIKRIDSLTAHRASDGLLVWSAILQSNPCYSIEEVGDGDFALVIYSEHLSFQPLFGQGPYYLVVTVGDHTWVSDLFLSAGALGPETADPNPTWINPWKDKYIELSWWDEQDFVTDDSIVVYHMFRHPGQLTQFKNRLYLMTDIGMPEYRFEEEGEERDGYFFAHKQLSKKVYRFKFLAPEYLCDSLRLVRMADHIQIQYDGHIYVATNFTPTFEWQEGGLLAAVTVEFETNTVAKKIGWGKVPTE